MGREERGQLGGEEGQGRAGQGEGWNGPAPEMTVLRVEMSYFEEMAGLARTTRMGGTMVVN